jgi:penicillin-binding protein 1A
MAHAVRDLRAAGELTYGTLSPGEPDNRKVTPIPGPVGIEAIGAAQGTTSSRSRLGGHKLQNRKRNAARSPRRRDQVGSILQTVVKSGTATRAFVPGVTIAGKTGHDRGLRRRVVRRLDEGVHVAIWVGYPDKFKPMETEFQGDPVAGGTYPAGIFKTFVDALVGMKKVKKDTTEVAPAVPPAARREASRTRRARPTRAAAIEGRRRPAGLDPGAPAGAPADPAPEQEQPAAPPPEQPAQPAPETPAEPPSDTGGAEPAPGTG